MRRRFEAFRGYVTILAVTIVSTVVLLLIGNQLAQSYLRQNPKLLMSAADRLNENTRAVREGMIPPDKAKVWYDLKSGDEAKLMWDEYYAAGSTFQSYVHFHSKTAVGNYYGVTEAGYRLTREPGPWPPDPNNFNVFFFGGSTSFGVGPYWATTASYLQDVINTSGQSPRKTFVYNFGRSGYISSQEVVLLGRLLSDGLRPNAVVFLDGLNDFCFWDGQPSGAGAIANFFNTSNEEYQRQAAGFGIVTHWEKLKQFTETMPLIRLLDGLLFQKPDDVQYVPTTEAPPDKPESDEVLHRVIDRYIANMRQVRALGREFSFKTVIVWQPIPSYKYDVSNHVFNPSRLGCHINSKVGYPIMRKKAEGNPLGDTFVWAADMQESLKEPLYVDAFHYTAPMSRRVAEFIFANGGKWQ